MKNINKHLTSDKIKLSEQPASANKEKKINPYLFKPNITVKPNGKANKKWLVEAKSQGIISIKSLISINTSKIDHPKVKYNSIFVKYIGAFKLIKCIFFNWFDELIINE